MNYSANGGSSFETYYYVLNLQGDVVKLVEILASSSGVESYSEVANYAYDAWGNIISSTGDMEPSILYATEAITTILKPASITSKADTMTQ